MGATSGKLQFADAITEFEIVDKYNYVLHLKYWHNQLLQSLGWVPMYSMDAYMKSGADDAAREAWATENLRRHRSVHPQGVQPRPVPDLGEEPQLLAEGPAVSGRHRGDLS